MLVPIPMARLHSTSILRAPSPYAIAATLTATPKRVSVRETASQSDARQKVVSRVCGLRSLPWFALLSPAAAHGPERLGRGSAAEDSGSEHYQVTSGR